MPHLQGPLHVDFQQNVLAGGHVIQGRVLGGAVIIAINLGIFQKLIAIEPAEEIALST
jgi:hypothetical protein